MTQAAREVPIQPACASNSRVTVGMFQGTLFATRIERAFRAMASIEREVRRLVGKAISHYDLIQDGDRIAVAVSGGKDSVLLLWLLRERLQRIPIRYDLTAVHVDPGFDATTADRLEAFFLKEGFDYRIIRTDYGPRAHGPENRENPCFLCARLRRATLFRKARDLNCQKIALGHNQDDLIETFFINICYGGQTATMVPKQLFFGGQGRAPLPAAWIAHYRQCLPVGRQKQAPGDSQPFGAALQGKPESPRKRLSCHEPR